MFYCFTLYLSITVLTTIKGATSYESLRTFQDIVYPTFHDACLARGLLEDDGEWAPCLQDASAMQTGKQLRALFAVILRDCLPAQPAILWMQFRQHICDDLKYALSRINIPDASEDQVYDYGLYLIDQLLAHSNKSLADYPLMPTSQMNWNLAMDNRLIAEQRAYDAQEQQRIAEEHISKLNTNQ